MTRQQCDPLSGEKLDEQHRLYMAAMSGPGGPPVDVGGLLMCNFHRRPLIECHDERKPRVSKPWYYFGCGRGPGHYLFDERMNQVRGDYSSPPRRLAERFDGLLPPQPERTEDLYKAALSRLGGYGYSALSWWDRSEDKRGGCNSTIFAPSLIIEPLDLLEEAQRRFPWVFTRLPQQLELWKGPGA